MTGNSRVPAPPPLASFLKCILRCRANVQPNISALGKTEQWDPAFTNSAKEEALLSIVGGLLDCSERLLTEAQPVPVPIPSSAFFMLLVRILSFSEAALPPGRPAHLNGHQGILSLSIKCAVLEEDSLAS